MGTVLTVLIVIYFIVVLFIMIEKKIDSMPQHQSKESNEAEAEWINTCKKKRKHLLNFALGLSDSPTCDIPSSRFKK